jgi:hypothetical protein
MTKQNPDLQFDQLIKAALVPKGHRPRTPEEVDRMLDLIDAPEVSDHKLQRMLRKINGEEPMFVEPDTQAPQPNSGELTAAERELVALYRSQGKDLPPEIQEKLRVMEERASRPPDDEEPDGGG